MTPTCSVFFEKRQKQTSQGPVNFIKRQKGAHGQKLSSAIRPKKTAYESIPLIALSLRHRMATAGQPSRTDNFLAYPHNGLICLTIRMTLLALTTNCLAAGQRRHCPTFSRPNI